MINREDHMYDYIYVIAWTPIDTDDVGIEEENEEESRPWASRNVDIQHFAHYVKLAS